MVDEQLYIIQVVNPNRKELLRGGGYTMHRSIKIINQNKMGD
jgi:hypothetical protein